MKRLSLIAICFITVSLISACASSSGTTVAVGVSERWDFTFDSRQWQLGYQAEDKSQAIREYVLRGQTVHNWTELVTSQYFMLDVSVRALSEQFKIAISQGCPTLHISTIEETSDTIIFEWQHSGCRSYPSQHEIRRYSKGRTGVLSIAFAEKTRQLAQEKRNTWVTIIKNASIKPGT